MAFTFRLPDLGEGITEAEIIEWLVADGAPVSEHQPLLRVETDKALVEIPSPASGRLGQIRHQAGDTVRVGEILVSILDEGESQAATPQSTRATTVVGVLPDEPIDLPAPGETPAAPPAGDVLAIPAVRRLARELGVSIEAVHGSGVNGRVTEADVREYASGLSASSASPPADDSEATVQRLPLRGIRRTIARRLKTAVAEAALATHMDEIDVSALLEQVRAHSHPDGHVGAFAWIVKATALALRKHPRFNATLDSVHEEVLVNPRVHIGIAVDTADGLMVPVVRCADAKSVAEIATEVERLAAACRGRAIEISTLRGGTFSISNIGSLGGLFATPIPNYPEVAILATGRMVERLVRTGDGSIVGHMLLPVSLTFDHRVLDGADAARFVNTLAEIVAQPDQLSS